MVVPATPMRGRHKCILKSKPETNRCCATTITQTLKVLEPRASGNSAGHSCHLLCLYDAMCERYSKLKKTLHFKILREFDWIVRSLRVHSAFWRDLRGKLKYHSSERHPEWKNTKIRRIWFIKCRRKKSLFSTLILSIFCEKLAKSQNLNCDCVKTVQ